VTTAVISARDLRVSYGGREVLRQPELVLQAGGRYALTGRSGSGKTTLLLVLAGLLRPNAGTVVREVETRDIIYVPQAPSLVAELTVLENASLGLRLRGVTPARAESDARDQLDVLGLAGTEAALPEQLSGGMQQRVALARSLAIHPDVLLADEPTGALDAATAERVVTALVDQASAAGATLVIATHDPRVAARFDSQLTVGGSTS